MSDFTEAPAAATIRGLYRGRDVMWTIRGDTEGEVAERVGDFLDWLDESERQHPTPATQPIPQRQAAPPPAQQPVHANPAAPGDGSDLGGGSIPCSFFDVEAGLRNGDPVLTVKFWKHGRQYPEFTATLNPDKAADGWLRWITDGNLATMRHNLPVVVRWAWGRAREDGKGKVAPDGVRRFQDIVDVTAAE